MSIEEQTALRSALLATRDRLRGDLQDRDDLIAAGKEAGIPITELAALAGLSRQAVYDILRKTPSGRRAVMRDRLTQLNKTECPECRRAGRTTIIREES